MKTLSGVTLPCFSMRRFDVGGKRFTGRLSTFDEDLQQERGRSRVVVIMKAYARTHDAEGREAGYESRDLTVLRSVGYDLTNDRRKVLRNL